MPTNNTKMGEILHKRTRNSKTWINFDGSYTTEIHSGDIHYKDEDGNLHNINTDLFDEADFDDMDFPVTKESAFDFRMMSRVAKELKTNNKLNRENMDFQALKVPFEAKIPRHFQSGYSIGKGQDKLKFKPVKSSPARGYVHRDSGNTITYQDVWNDADVELQVLPTGIKETITLKTDRAPSSFSFEVTGNVDSLTELKLHDAWLEDAEGTRRDIEQSIRNENGKAYVDLVADVADLVYPIAIDPTVTVASNDIQDAQINLNDLNDNRGQYEFVTVGRFENIVFRGFFKFGVSIPSNAVITNATLSSYSQSAFDPAVFTVHQVLGTWEEDTITSGNSPNFGTAISQYTNEIESGIKIFDIKTAVQNWVNGQSNYGVMIKAQDENVQENNDISLYSSENTGSFQKPLVEITYNQTPSAPTITSPNGAETINSAHTITWTAGTDTEGDALVYDIQLSTDNGTSWNTIASGVNGTFYEYDFSNAAETSTALIRIRAYDGTSYSAWDESDGVFTINHNDAPNTPTNLSPNGGEPVDYLSTVRFSWQHNDDNSNDPQSKYDLGWRVVGNATWNMVTNSTTQNYYDMPGGVLPADSNIEWRVRTYDQDGLSSPYSAIAKFFAGEKPEQPIYTAPEGDASVANPVIQWSSVNQASYLLEVYQGTTLVYSYTGGTNKAHTIQTDLQNNTMYELRLSITNPEGLTSDPQIKNMYVSYTSPSEPSIVLDEDNASGTITTQVNIPEVSGTEPEVTHYEVYRALQGGSFIRIAKNIPPIIDYVDFTPESGALYEYYIRAWGDNGTYQDSAVQRGSITLTNALIHSTIAPDEYIELDKVTGTSHSSGVERSTLQFAGRKAPVTYFGQGEEWGIDTEFLIKGDIAMKTLRLLANSRQVLLYRDERGRKSFITLAGVSESDVIGNEYYRVSLSPIQTYYEEEV